VNDSCPAEFLQDKSRRPDQHHRWPARSSRPTCMGRATISFPQTSHVPPALLTKDSRCARGSACLRYKCGGKPRCELLHVDDLADACSISCDWSRSAGRPEWTRGGHSLHLWMVPEQSRGRETWRGMTEPKIQGDTLKSSGLQYNRRLAR